MSKESFAIKLSIYGTGVMAFTGILASIFGNSASLLFDALYSVIAMIISIGGLSISKLLKVKYSPRFNFGYYAFEPLFVLTNGVLTMILAITLFISSIECILHGGRIIELAVVTQYLLFSVIVCSGLTLTLRYYGRKTNSEILMTESINWMLDALISVVVLVVFLLSIWLKNTSANYLIPYLDPGITIVLILFFIYQPYKLVKSGLLDLLRAAPSKEFIDDIKSRLDKHKATYGFHSTHLNAAKVGRMTTVEIQCFFDPNFQFKTLENLDQLKHKIKTEVEGYAPFLDVRVYFEAK